MGFAALFAANIASMFVPATAQPFMFSVITYGGVVLFSGFILHYTQGLVHRAKAIPPDSNLPGTRPNFDPVNKLAPIWSLHFLVFKTPKGCLTLQKPSLVLFLPSSVEDRGK